MPVGVGVGVCDWLGGGGEIPGLPGGGGVVVPLGEGGVVAEGVVGDVDVGGMLCVVAVPVAAPVAQDAGHFPQVSWQKFPEVIQDASHLPYCCCTIRRQESGAIWGCWEL